MHFVSHVILEMHLNSSYLNLIVLLIVNSQCNVGSAAGMPFRIVIGY